MRIKRFYARGYRSLRDVTLDDLGPFAVFYGPNGSGKSNIIAAIRTLFRLLPLTMTYHVPKYWARAEPADAWKKARGIVGDDDFFVLTRPRGAIVLGADVEATTEDAWFVDANKDSQTTGIEITCRQDFGAGGSLTLTRLVLDGQD